MEDRNRAGYTTPSPINLIIFQGGDCMTTYVYHRTINTKGRPYSKKFALTRDEYIRIVGYDPVTSGAEIYR